MDQEAGKSKKTQDKQKKSSKSKKVADDSFDDLMGESKDLFFDDISDNSNYNSENSTDKIENYLTE